MRDRTQKEIEYIAKQCGMTVPEYLEMDRRGQELRAEEREWRKKRKRWQEEGLIAKD